MQYAPEIIQHAENWFRQSLVVKWFTSLFQQSTYYLSTLQCFLISNAV